MEVDVDFVSARTFLDYRRPKASDILVVPGGADVLIVLR